MKKLENVKGIIFDYGGTIDTNSMHWAEVLWMQYQKHQVPVTREAFREAYVFGERTLAKYPFVRPSHNFHDILVIKLKLHMEYLALHRHLPMDEAQLLRWSTLVADSSYAYVIDVMKITRPVVAGLSRRYPLVLVSNFYGNIETILADFGLLSYFSSIVESAVVGIRKPDPAIYQLGVDRLGFAPGQVVVVGDSFSKDVVPAKKVGCRVVWLKGIGWGNEETDENLPDCIITDMAQLPSLF